MNVGYRLNPSCTNIFKTRADAEAFIRGEPSTQSDIFPPDVWSWLRNSYPQGYFKNAVIEEVQLPDNW